MGGADIGLSWSDRSVPVGAYAGWSLGKYLIGNLEVSSGTIFREVPVRAISCERLGESVVRSVLVF